MEEECGGGEVRLFKEEDKFCRRIMAKDLSRRFSSRVFYYTAPASVPFRWEEEPGKPKLLFGASDGHFCSPPRSNRGSSTVSVNSGSGSFSSAFDKLSGATLSPPPAFRSSSASLELPWTRRRLASSGGSRLLLAWSPCRVSPRVSVKPRHQERSKVTCNPFCQLKRACCSLLKLTLGGS